MLGIVEKRSDPRVDTDDIVDEVSVLSRYEGGGLCEGTGIRGPLAFTSVAPFFVSELEEESFGTMIIVKCNLEGG